MTPTIDQTKIVAQKPWEKAACFFLIIGSLSYYWLVFFQNALDAGQGDDFVDVLWFFEIFRAQTSWLDKLAVIALPNHEHVTIFNHLVYLADYALFRQLNFFHYMVVGHLIVLGCCLILAEWLRKSVGWWFSLAIAFGMFLSLFYWHASFWAMTALSNQALILFALLAARSTSNNPDAVVIPLLWAMLAVLVQFNGLLVLPALIAASVIVAVVEKRKQNTTQLLVWFFVFLSSSALYFFYENPFAKDHLWRYVEYTDPGKIAEYVKPSYGPDVSTMQAMLNVPLTFLSAAGATVFGLQSWAMPALTGAAFMLCLLRALLHNNAMIKDRFWLMLVLFVLVSLVLIGVGRGLGFGPEAGLYYRYRLYSFLLLFLLTGAMLIRSLRRRNIFACVLAAVVIQFSSLHVLDDIEQERENVKISHYNWLIDGGMGRSQMPFYPHNQDWRLLNAYQNGYYNPYRAIDRRHQPVAVSRVDYDICRDESDKDISETSALKIWSKKPRALAAEITLDMPVSKSPVLLLFCDNVSAYQVELDSRNINPLTGKYWPVLVLKKDLPPSQYQVVLRDMDKGSAVLGQVSFP